MTNSIVEIHELSRRFGNTLALDFVSLTLRPGQVYGLVGANGAGKTTLIKHLLGLLRAKQGSVRVFGLDPVLDPVKVLQNIGYLSEDREMPEWMRIAELLRYTGAYHPGWDNTYARELIETFRLDPTKKIKNLSKGMRAQAGLIAAVAHRPELLILDEPSTGLDAIVRKDILNEIVRAVADDGRTAIFSSHLLDEVELMSDYVFMIDGGKIVLEGEVDRIREKHQLCSVVFERSQDHFPTLPSLLSAEGHGNAWTIVCEVGDSDLSGELSMLGGRITKQRSANLQETFVAKVGRRNAELVEAQ